jgi:hypothetical protein
MARRGWFLVLGAIALVCGCLSVGVIGAAGLWFLTRDQGSPTPGIAANVTPALRRTNVERNQLANGWQRVSDGQRVAYLPPAQGNLPFQPGLFWQAEPLPQPLNPLQYAAVVYLRLQQQSEQLYAYHAQWVSFAGWPAIELAYAAVQNGQPYEAVLWILSDGWTGYIVSFIAPYGLLDEYVPQLPQVLQDAEQQLIEQPGPLQGGPVPDVWVDGGGMGYGGEMTPAWDWSAFDYGTPLYGFDDPFADVGWDSGGYDFSGDLYSDLYSSGGGLYDPEHDAFNTWMAEEWSQALSGENPDPTWMDDAGNLYWEGPSGTLHDWSADYDPSIW